MRCNVVFISNACIGLGLDLHGTDFNVYKETAVEFRVAQQSCSLSRHNRQRLYLLKKTGNLKDVRRRKHFQQET
jgi:hypothetical protein